MNNNARIEAEFQARVNARITEIHAAMANNGYTSPRHVCGDQFVGLGDLVREQAREVQEVLQGFLRGGYAYGSTT